MSWIFRRKDVQVSVIVITFAVVFIPYMFEIPQLQYLSGKFVIIAAITNAFALVLGLYGAIRRASTYIRQRTHGWIIHVYMLLLLGIMTVSGFIGTDNTVWMFLMESVIKPLGSVNYSLLAFYMASAGARAMRARSLKATVLLIAGFIVLLGQAPFTAAVFPIIDPAYLFLNDTMSLAVGRMFTVATSIGGIVMGIRVLTGREVTFLGLSTEEG